MGLLQRDLEFDNSNDSKRKSNLHTIHLLENCGGGKVVVMVKRNLSEVRNHN